MTTNDVMQLNGTIPPVAQANSNCRCVMAAELFHCVWPLSLSTWWLTHQLAAPAMQSTGHAEAGGRVRMSEGIRVGMLLVRVDSYRA